MNDKLTCRMLCNEHADHDQEDEQDSESPHCSSRWLHPQVMLYVTGLLLIITLLFVTWVIRGRFMITQILRISSDPFSSLWRPTDNGREQRLSIDGSVDLGLLPGGWGDRGSGNFRVCDPWVRTAIVSQAFTEKRIFTSGISLVYWLSCRTLLASYYFIFWYRIFKIYAYILQINSASSRCLVKRYSS